MVYTHADGHSSKY